MSASLFEKIVAGDLPSHRVYEDEHVYAFLDIGPVSRGHVLLIPKRCFVELDEVPADVGAALGAALPKLVRAVKAATGCAGVNVLQNNGVAAGQAVMHVHFHLIPRYADDAPHKERFRFDWPAGTLADEDAKQLVDAIVGALD
ncbi:MAG: HIT family protein [Planctomycetota bacterium]